VRNHKFQVLSWLIHKSQHQDRLFPCYLTATPSPMLFNLISFFHYKARRVQVQAALPAAKPAVKQQLHPGATGLVSTRGCRSRGGTRAGPPRCTHSDPLHLRHFLLCVVFCLQQVIENGDFSFSAVPCLPCLCHRRAISGGRLPGRFATVWVLTWLSAFAWRDG